MGTITKNEVYGILVKNGEIDQFMLAKADPNIIPATRAKLIEETFNYDFTVPEYHAMLYAMVPTIISQKSYDDIMAICRQDLQSIQESTIIVLQPIIREFKFSSEPTKRLFKRSNGWEAIVDFKEENTNQVYQVNIFFDHEPTEQEFLDSINSQANELIRSIS